MGTKIMLVDVKNTRYLFLNTGEVFINGQLKGMGRLITPIKQIGLRQQAIFSLEGHNFLTAPLKACAIDD